MPRKKDDCDIIIDNVGNVFKSLDNCLETTFDDRKTKMNVVSSIFDFGKSLTKLAFNTTTCAIKNTPKAVIAVASVKREIVTAIENEVKEHQKQIKADALYKKIKHLELKA